MWSIRVSLEAVTPLFLGGSEPGDWPELRAASVRGAMRFWYRALVGGRVHDVGVVRAEEARVFGDAGETGGSRVVVRVAGKPQPVGFGGGWGVGLRYLFFSVQSGRGRRRGYFPPGARFDVVLQLRSPSGGPGQEDLFRRVGAAFWLLVRLGGLGARVRRGAGGLRAVGEAAGWPQGLPPLVVSAESPPDLKDELEVGLGMLGKAVAVPAAGGVPAEASFDVLGPGLCRIGVLDRTWETWEQALDAMGGALQQFRCCYERDSSEVKCMVVGSRRRLQAVERAAFGLPVVFHFPSLNDAKATLRGERHDRRASPVWIRAVRLASGKYAVVLAVFRAPLLPHGERLKLETGDRWAVAPAPTLEPIDCFLDEVCRPGGRHYLARLLEVEYR